MNCPAGVPEIHTVTKSQRVNKNFLISYFVFPVRLCHSGGLIPYSIFGGNNRISPPDRTGREYQSQEFGRVKRLCQKQNALKLTIAYSQKCPIFEAKQIDSTKKFQP
jgi:hypothetical protein